MNGIPGMSEVPQIADEKAEVAQSLLVCSYVFVKGRPSHKTTTVYPNSLHRWSGRV